MARRGRGKGLEPRIPIKPAAPVKKAVAPAPAFVMPGTTPDLTSIDLSNIQIPNLPVVAPPVAVAPPPPPVAPAPAPVPIPQIDPAVLAQMQEQFNIPVQAPPPPPPVEMAPPPPPVAPPVQVPPPVFQAEPVPAPIPQPVPAPIPAPAPPPPPPPVEVASPPPPPPPPIPQISPEVLAQIQQEFNIPAAPPAPPVAPPVQVPPPVVPPEGIATLPQSPVEPPPAPVAQEFSLPPRRISEPVSQPEPLAGPGMPTPSGGFLPGIDLNNLDLSGLAVPNQVQPAPEPAPAPFSPSEQMGSNYIEPRDGPGQTPPRFTSGEDFMSDYNPMASGTSMGNPTNLGTGIPTGDDVTGIETMAPAVGFGDYINSEVTDSGLPAGTQANTSESISLPDGSTFDLGSLDLSGIDIGGFGSMSEGFDLNNVNVGGEQAFNPFAGVTGGLGPGGYGPEGGGFTPPYNTEPEFDRGNIGFGPVAVDGGYSYDGNGNEINGGPAGGAPVFNPPQGAVDEAQGTTYNGNNFTPDLSGLDLDFSNLDLSGLDLGNLNIGGEGGAGNNSYNPEDQGGPQGGPGNTMGGTDASGNGNTNTNTNTNTGSATGNPYPFIPDGIDTSQMTPDMLAGLNTFYENGGLDGLNLNLGGLYGGGSYTGTVGTGTTDGSYTVTPVDPVGDLGVGDDTGDASDPIDVTTPYVPPNVRSASSYSLTGATPTRPVVPNPFQRPESQQGLGSLAGGG